MGGTMEFSLTDEQLRLQQLARRFAYDELQPRARELDREADVRDAFPRELIRRAAGAAGTMGAALFPAIVPASALGRGGRTAPSNRIVLGHIGVGDPALRRPEVLRGRLQHAGRNLEAAHRSADESGYGAYCLQVSVHLPLRRKCRRLGWCRWRR